MSRLFCPTFSTILIVLLLVPHCKVQSQALTNEYLQILKQDQRGPYKDIKWFCEDGSIREARDPCPEPMEGVQHARYKDNIQRYADNDHIYLDQILVGTEFEDFWDLKNQNSRIKQYQITNFLYDADDGWILQTAKNYRGAKQIEDEQKWGQKFLEWIVNSDQRIKDNYLLLRLVSEDIPHGEDNRVSQRVRAYSKLLADENPKFMNLRIKIHNNPSRSDITATENWTKDKKLSQKEQESLDLLIENMEEMHKPFDVQELQQYINYLPEESTLYSEMKDYSNLVDGASTILRVSETCRMLRIIRKNIFDTKWKEARVKMLDLSNHLEDILINDLSEYKTESLSEIRDKFCYLTDALYGAGYIEEWEFDQVKNDLDWLQGRSVSLVHLDSYRYATNKLVQWSTQMVQSLFVEPLSVFRPFEPKVEGFVDDKVRSSVILPLGRTVERLNNLFNETAQAPSSIMGDTKVSGLQGLNPGLAKGKLVVLAELEEGTDLDSDKIYAFDRPPSDLKPVAGILNVKEGNPVSHVQLLARNLAIPNALITTDVLKSLEKYDGKEVFYAVSPKGTLILKAVSDMTKQEAKLFSTKSREKKKLTIYTKDIVLHPDSLLNMSQIGSSSSGKWCGPKAANLGQLKQQFPDQVVEGVVIPFGVFKDHMMQDIPTVGESYWEFLARIFRNERALLSQGIDQKEVECITLQELGLLRKHIEKMPLKKSLVTNLEHNFSKLFGNEMGRQQYLDNPEEVYPSILIIPSVNVDKSGVIITKGVSRGNNGDMSVSFSRGVGGAVDGQSAESYVIYQAGYTELISPGRETKYRSIPATGGSTVKVASFSEPVLSMEDRRELKSIADQISAKMNQVTGSQGPYDIELGIKDGKIWLFQVRPFVENKSATSSDYLKSFDPVFKDKYVILDEF